LPGKYPAKYPSIFDDPVKGAEAAKLFAEGQDYVRQIIQKKIIRAKGVFGLYPAVSEGDDVKILHSEAGRENGTVFRFLRNQEKKEAGVPNLCLSDYIAPVTSGLTDTLGAFVVTAEIDRDKYAEYGDDDYGTIMIRILSDRFAEAAAEWLHEIVRKEYWGYAADENLNVDEMLKLKYRGIRPAPGYPACPDHTEKRALFDLLDAERNIGGPYRELCNGTTCRSKRVFLCTPQSAYFNIGKIGNDQLADYADRKSMTVEEASRWLAPNL
jgi:5-methyltetrahydrofolate--homocysteine methyltransferase